MNEKNKLGIKFSLEKGIGGSQRTIAECLLKEIMILNPNYIFFTRTAESLAFLNIPKKKLISFPNFRTGSLMIDMILSKVFDQLFLELIAIFSRCKVIYYPYNHEAVWKTFLVSQVITVHDLIPILYPDQFPKLKFFWRYFNIPAIKNASKIVAVSNKTKWDLKEYLNVADDRVNVVYNGFNESLTKGGSPLDTKLVTSPYFFYLASTLYPYKNLQNLISAFEVFREDKPEYKLFIVGKKIARFDYLYNLNDGCSIEVLENLSEKALNKLFANAAAFIYPSFYEGFGIPPLESMQFGIPVAASKAASIPEVCGEAAIYFDPFSVSDIVNCMKRIVSDTFLRENLIKKGHVQVRQFSWKASAIKIIEICQTFK